MLPATAFRLTDPVNLPDMLRMIYQPTVGKKAVKIFISRIRAQTRQLLKQITKISPRLNTHMLAGLNQTHQNGGPPAALQTPNKKPAFP